MTQVTRKPRAVTPRMAVAATRLAAAAVASLALAAGACAADGAFATTPSAPVAGAAAAPRQAHRTVHGDALEERVERLTKALDLDAGQQVKLRQILARQRDAVHRIWTDSTLLPAERGPAVRAATDRTADEIRGILNDEQRQRYRPPRPPPSKALQEADTNVDSWIDTARGKAPAPPTARN